MNQKILVIICLAALAFFVRESKFSVSELVYQKIADKVAKDGRLVDSVVSKFADGYHSPYGPGQDAWVKFTEKSK